MRAQSEAGAHPLAGKRMSGAEMIIQVLADEGVDTIFGYSGGAILPTYDAIFRFNAAHKGEREEQIRLIVPANEQGAGFMAAGYARASGKVGVFLVTSGPGATNSVTPIRDCMADSVPVVLICGQVPRHAIGTDAFQEAPVFNVMSSCAKHVFLVEEPEELEATVRTAFEIARSGPARSGGDRRPQGRAELGGLLQGRRPAPLPRVRGAHEGAGRIAGCRRRSARVSMNCSGAASARSFTPAAASSRRRVRAAAQFLRDAPDSRGHHAHGNRIDGHAGARWPCTCSACTAWPTPTTRSRTAIS